MGTIGIIICVVVILMLFALYLKAKHASKKPVSERSSMDTILVSLFVMGKKSVNDAANEIRTPEISREEAIQKTKEAIQDLSNDFKSQLIILKQNEAKIENKTLPNLRNQPGKLEGKAKLYKKRMDAALKEGKEDIANMCKKNAIEFLSMKKEALKRVDVCEKKLEDIKNSIEKSEILYDSKKSQLEAILFELDTMMSDISLVNFNKNLNIVESLRQETVDKMREQNVAIEAENIVNGDFMGDSSELNSDEFEDELKNL